MVTANPLPFDAFQQSRFFEAVRTDKIEHALDALSKGADINRPEATGGITGLQIGALKGFLAMVRALLEQGADPNMPNGGNNTALTIAIKNRNYMLIEPLLEYGADPNHMAQGANPLHMISSCTPFYKVHDLRREPHALRLP